MTENEASGYADFIVEGRKYQTWYMIYGDLNPGRTPLVTLHGGPGLTSHYMKVHKILWEKEQIPIIIYDQLGNGKSTHLGDEVPKEFWTPELFMNEIDNLVKHLGIENNFDLLGHSWGGALGAHYAATRYHHKGLKHLIIASPICSTELFYAGLRKLLHNFGEGVVKMIEEHEAEGTYDDPEYVQVVTMFAHKYICNLEPWPEGLQLSMADLSSDSTVYSSMMGPSEYYCKGTLQYWDIRNILPNISVPTLLIGGSVEDEVQPENMTPFFNLIKNIKYVLFHQSTHMTAYEEPERYERTVLQFLK